jgi:hypothetical protein
MMIRMFFTGALMLLSLFQALAQSSSQQFIDAFAKHEGQYYEGKIVAGGKEDDGFMGNRLIMQVMKWSENEVKVPFFVGTDKSRTWIFTLDQDRVKLKHDHRHEDGSPDEVTFYGGTANTSGTPHMQMFPADQETCTLIDYACFNVWWVTIDDTKFTYNLRRIGTDRWFSVEFDLTKPVISDFKPW